LAPFFTFCQKSEFAVFTITAISLSAAAAVPAPTLSVVANAEASRVFNSLVISFPLGG
jgi:hypothetical protein